VKQVRLTHQAVRDLEAFDQRIRERIKESLRYLADHPPEDKPLKGRFFRRTRCGPIVSGRIVFCIAQ
jgi:mRNA-degrading endonuclease RelE of RelBE toxin-antitoxin system